MRAPGVQPEARTMSAKYRLRNGFFTVIGTAVALMLGMAGGFTAVLVIAALCYVIALAAMLRRETLLPA